MLLRYINQSVVGVSEEFDLHFNIIHNKGKIPILRLSYGSETMMYEVFVGLPERMNWCSFTQKRKAHLIVTDNTWIPSNVVIYKIILLNTISFV